MIGKVAKEAGVLQTTIRYYSELGLLKVRGRTQGGYRLYNKKETIERFRQIERLIKEGLTLEKIRERLN